MKKKLKVNRGKKKQQKKTYVAIVLDKSGSMSAVKRETINGFNEQADTIIANADKGGDTFVSLLTFDTDVNVLFDKSPVNVLEHLNDTSYQPDGGTAMRDAVWDAIVNLEKTEVTDETAYLVIVISDGEENSSVRTPPKMLADKISALQSTGRWTFAYMGANQDLSEISEQLNIPIANTVKWTSTPTGTTRGMMANNAAVANYFTSARAVGCSSSDTFYTPSNTVTAASSPTNVGSWNVTDVSLLGVKPPKKTKKTKKN